MDGPDVSGLAEALGIIKVAAMNIAITGGAGFIGTELAKALKKDGHAVTLIDICASDIFPEDSKIADVRDSAALTAALQGADSIYHLAAEHRDDVRPIQRYYDVNVGGAKNVVAAAKAHNIQKIIFSSSVALYGLGEKESREEDTPDPFNDYGRSKWESERVFNAWAAEDPARSLTTVRLVATFGEGNRGNIYNLLAQIASGKFVMVGNGKNKKTIAYVGNVVAFLKYCLNFFNGAHLYNYADKPDLSMEELVREARKALGYAGMGLRLPYIAGMAGGLTFDAMAKMTGKNFPISAIRVKKFCANTVVSADKIERTGFKRPCTLEEGLKIMIDAEFNRNLPSQTSP